MTEKLFEAILEMNKQMLLNGFDANYEMVLSSDDFTRLASYMVRKFEKFYVEPPQDPKKWTQFKIAGPGGYTTIKRLL